MEMLIYNLLADQVSCDNGLGQTAVCKWTWIFGAANLKWQIKYQSVRFKREALDLPATARQWLFDRLVEK